MAFLAGCLLSLLPFAWLTVRLFDLGEIDIFERGPAAAQIRLHGTLAQDPRFKLFETERLRPEVVVLGSSRSLYWRDYILEGCVGKPGCFYGAGGAMVDALRNGLEYVRAIDVPGSPRVLIIAFDIWDLNPKQVGTTHQATPLLTDYLGRDPISRVKGAIGIVRTYAGLALQDQSVRDALIGRTPRAADVEGVIAMTRDQGFRRDGSIAMQGRKENANAPAQIDAVTVAQLVQGTYRNAFFDHVDPLAVAELEELLDIAARNGTQVLLYTTLWAPDAAAAIAATPQQRAGFEDAEATLRRVLTARGIPFLIARSITDIGCEPDEYWDGSHDSEVCDARIVRKLMEQPKAAQILAPYTSIEYLDRLIADRYSRLWLRPPD